MKVGKVDPLVVLMQVMLVANMEEVAGHLLRVPADEVEVVARDMFQRLRFVPSRPLELAHLPVRAGEAARSAAKGALSDCTQPPGRLRTPRPSKPNRPVRSPLLVDRVPAVPAPAGGFAPASDQCMRDQNADPIDFEGVTSAEQDGEGKRRGRLPCQGLPAETDQNGT